MEKEEIIEVLRNELTSETIKEIINLFEKEESHEKYLKRRSRNWEISLNHNDDQSYMIEVSLAIRQIPTSEQAYQNWLIEQLQIALSQLNSIDRAIIDMLFYWELTEREVAEKLGVRQQTLHERKTRILRDLEKKLKKFVD